MLSGDYNKALRRIREACSIPGATFFQVHSFRGRLSLLDELDYKPEFIKPALEIVSNTFLAKNKYCTCNRVFLWAGQAVDRSDQQTRHSSNGCGEFVKRQIDKALEEWKVGKNDLAICEGIQESDLLFAEACHKLGARVRVMLLDPPENTPLHTLWPFRSPEIEQRFHDLRATLGSDVWFHRDHLGWVASPSAGKTPKEARQRHRRWLINTARMEAEKTLTSVPIDPESSDADSDRLFGLFLWNGRSTSQDAEDPSYYIRLVNEFSDYRGRVKVISLEPESATPTDYQAAQRASGITPLI
jgi:hypothetical protein